MGVEQQPGLHREEFIHLVDLYHDRVLITWGAFWFRRDEAQRSWVVIGDPDLPELVGREGSIGHDAAPFGDSTVEVLDEDGKVVAEARTDSGCWVWLEGLRPDTEYRYRIVVDGEEWAAGQRWDLLPSADGGYDLAPGGSYDLRFRTFPDPEAATPAVRFAAMGDYGVGIAADDECSRRQRRVSEVLEEVVSNHDVRFVLSLGDTIYDGERGQTGRRSGDRDSDWHSSFYAPYRYAIARVPVFPTIGNHDSRDSEVSDDRVQMEDKFHLHARFGTQEHRASMGPGLFYRFGFGRDLELVCVDTSEDSHHEEHHRYFQVPSHQRWLEDAMSVDDVAWRIPFSHHPVYCAGPHHGNDEEMIESLLPLFERGGVRLALAGHEHNFQVSEVDGRTYVVSGAAGQLRDEDPEELTDAGTVAFASQAHLLLVDVDGDEARLTPVCGLLPDGSLQPMTALSPEYDVVRPPYVVRRDG